MKAYTEKMHQNLLSKLDELDRKYDPLNLMDPRLGIVDDTIEKIYEKMKSKIFTSSEEEAHYFKSILPPILALHFYYSDKMEWDRISRQGSPECRYKFNDRIYSQAESLRKEYKSFFDYCRNGHLGLDNFFFLRNSPYDRESRCQDTRIIDPSSPPLHCEILAKGIAFGRLEHELKISVSENNPEGLLKRMGNLKLIWTGKQIDGIELGYALKEAGVFNNGQASLKEIFDFCGKVFGIDPGNTPRLFQNVLGRKSGYTPFIDKLRKKLNKRIDDIESENLN